MEICEAFSLLAELAMKDGADKQPLAQFWERDVGKWHISLNRENIERKNGEGIKVPAFTAAITYNGWPAGFIDPSGGIIAAGAAANEDTFIAAIKEQLPQHQRGNEP